MSEIRNQEGRPKVSLLKLAIGCAALIGVAAFLYVIAAAAIKPKPQGDILDLRQGDMAKLQIPGQPMPRNPALPDLDLGMAPPAGPPPTTAFRDGAGKPVRIGDFKGKVVVVNMWATWCAPCKVEMPTLAKLQAAYPNKVAVMPISMDEPDKEAEAAFFMRQNAPLKTYYAGGTKGMYTFDPPAPSLPATIIYDRKGVERARLIGDADWNGKEARAVIERLLAER